MVYRVNILARQLGICKAATKDMAHSQCENEHYQVSRLIPLLPCSHKLDPNTVRPYNEHRRAAYLRLETRHHALDARKGCLRRKVFDSNPEVVDRFNWPAFTMRADGIARRPEPETQLRWTGGGRCYPEQLFVKLLRCFQVGDRNLNMVDARRGPCKSRGGMLHDCG